MCGKLATYLRMCGYDAAYALDRGVEADDQVLALAAAEARTLITRDRELAARTGDAVLLTERDVLDQLREVAAAGSPSRSSTSRRAVAPVTGESIGCRPRTADPDDRPEYVPDDDVGTAGAPESEPDTADTRPAWRCRDCGRWFWKGSHWESIAERLDGI